MLAGSHHVQQPTWSSSTVSDGLLSTGLRCGVTAAPSFRQSASSGRTASLSQHVWPPGFCCGWPDGLDNLRDSDVTTDNFKRLLKTFYVLRRCALQIYILYLLYFLLKQQSNWRFARVCAWAFATTAVPCRHQYAIFSSRINHRQ